MHGRQADCPTGRLSAQGGWGATTNDKLRHGQQADYPPYGGTFAFLRNPTIVGSSVMGGVLTADGHGTAMADGGRWVLATADVGCWRRTAMALRIRQH